MSTHQTQNEIGQIFFCTITCHKWLPLIHEADAYEAVYNWFRYLQNKDSCIVIGYVIMPNHLHLLLQYRNESKTLNQIVGEGKRFMAYDIVKRLKQLAVARTSESVREGVANCMHPLLRKVSEEVSEKDRAKGKKHQIFITSFDAKPCYSRKMIEQKLDYIHRNPVSGKWNLVNDYINYAHSSACFYETGKQQPFEITHYLEL